MPPTAVFHNLGCGNFHITFEKSSLQLSGFCSVLHLLAVQCKYNFGKQKNTWSFSSFPSSSPTSSRSAKSSSARDMLALNPDPVYSYCQKNAELVNTRNGSNIIKGLLDIRALSIFQPYDKPTYIATYMYIPVREELAGVNTGC